MSIEPEQLGLSGGVMKRGDIVKFRKAVDAGEEDLRLILLEDPDGGRVLVESIVDMKAGGSSGEL